MTDNQAGSNPFDAIDPNETSNQANAVGATADSATVSSEPKNPFDEIDPNEQPEAPPSALGAAARGAERSILPALGSLPAIGAGAELGAAGGAAIGGPFAPLTGAVGGVLGGLAGAFGGAKAISAAQDWALSKAPDSWKDALGLSDRQQKLDEQTHPYATFLGGLVPYALTMRPGAIAGAKLPENATALQQIMANPVTARLFGGVAMGGMELGQEAASGENLDWRKAAISTGFGMVFNKPTRLGEAITEIGAQPARNTLNAVRLSSALDQATPGVPKEATVEAGAPNITPGEEQPSYPGVSFGSVPTVAEAGDAKVMGPGVTEQVFMGSHQMDPSAEMTAQEAARTEQSLFGPPAQQHDLHDVARRMEPETFQRYDELSARRDEFRKWVDDFRNPPAEDFDALQSQREGLEKQLAEVPTTGAGQDKPTARRLRAQIRDVQAQSDALAARRDSFAQGQGVETPELAAARQHLLAADYEMRDLAPHVSAAYRRAADAIGAGTVPPEETMYTFSPSNEDGKMDTPSATEPEKSPEGAAPARSLEAQRGFISNDVMQKLVAAGRPVDEAEASGNLIAARYEARAARFGGKLGSAEDLYRAEAPEIRGAGGAAAPVSRETPPPAPPPADVRIREAAPAPNRDMSALQYLRQAGGLARTPELAQVLDKGNKSLIKKGGLSLDDALQTLKEGGYLFDPADVRQGTRQLRDQDVLDLIEKEVRGQKVYPLGSERNIPEARAETPEMAQQMTAHETAVRQAMDAAGAPVAPGDDALVSRAAGYLESGVETDPANAYERAVMQESRDSDNLRTLGVYDDPLDFFQTARGKIRINPGSRPIITLMRDANASTFVHETGHAWLEELMHDADHPDAPDGLKDDATTVRDWLGVNEAGDIKTKHHEKFARGFEQYMREGVAPTPGLASVFGKFKNWLLSVYQTIKTLGKPINEDIRGVFDRLLAEEPNRTVIAPERAGGPTLADIHEADALHTEPHEAHAVADRIAAEAERSFQDLHPEVQRELQDRIIANARGAGNEPGSENQSGGGEGGPVEQGGGDAGAQPASGGGGAEPGSIVDGGTKIETESSPAAGNERGSSSAGRDGPPLATRPTRLLGGSAESPFLEKAGNIRLDKIDAPENVKQAIRDAADANNDFIGDRRGVVTDGQVLDLSYDIGMDFNRLSARKIGQAFSAEEIVAARRLLVDSAEAVSAAMEKAATGSDEDVLAYALARDRHQMIQGQIAGITAEAGRALRAFRNVAGSGKAQTTDQFVRTATGKTLFQLREEAKLGASLDSPQKISKYLADAKKRTFGRGILEYWINGLISGPATHTTYMIGNTILALERAGPETAAAAAIGHIRTLLGREGETVRLGEVGAQLKAFGQALPGGIEAALEAARSGQTTLLPGEKARPAIPFSGDMGLSIAKNTTNDLVKWSDVQGQVFGLVRGMRDGLISTGALIKNGGVEEAPLIGLKYSPLGQIPDVAVKGVNVLPVGTLARLPSRGVAAIHSFFRTTNYSMAKAAEAFRMASSEGLEGTAFDARVGEIRQNPSEELMERARDQSNNATLMGQGSEFVQQLGKLTNTEIMGFPFLKFVDPFVHIAGNIIDQSIVQRTPVGLLAPEIRADIMGKNGNVAQDTAMARMVVGTALSITFGGLAAQGLASGSGPKDPKEASMWRLAGNQAHSVKIGNIWYDTHRLGPVGMLMGIAADLYEVSHTAAKGDMLTAASMLQHAVTQNILDESFMRGPADLIQAIEDPGRYGEAYLRNFASSFVPYSVGMGQMARAADPYSRQARTVMDAIKNKIPGLSETLMPRRDIWGEPMLNPEAAGAKGVTAIYERAMNNDPVNQAMLQLGIYPSQVERKISNVQLTDQQYDDFARLAGRMTKKNLDRIVQAPDWQMIPPASRRYVIEETIRQDREAARGIMFMKYPSIPAQAVAQKKAKLNAPINAE